MSNTKQTASIRTSQQGFASMVIALILVLILSLLTVGFAQVARREQQSSLAKQLANQANYAAESAINDAIVDIKSGKINIGNAGNGTTCINPATVSGGLTSNQNVEPLYDVTYSCLLVNLQPPSLIKQPLDPDKGWTVVFNTDLPLSSLSFRWESTTAGRVPQGLRANTGFLTPAAWAGSNAPGVLQVSITPLSLLSGTDRDSMIRNTFTAFLYPSNEVTSSANYTLSTAPGNAPIISGNCPGGAGTFCVSTINNLPPTAGTGPFVMHVIDYYDSSNIIVTGKSGPTAVKFINGQAQVDATGKAKNVLKRLQARVSLNGPILPDFAIEAGDVCKREETGPIQTFTDPDPIGVNTPNPNGTKFFDTGGAEVFSPPSACYLEN